VKNGWKMKVLNIGFGNVIAAQRVVAVLSPEPAPMKRLKEAAEKEGLLVDATHGRKTRSLIITDSGHVFLSNIQPETISQRLQEESVEE
jgi:regulator of extracellular matrix RemA (YlzA/DUF370 family)